MPALNPVPLSIISFSYRKGVPETADYVFDARFLENPHWQEKLRNFSGKDEAVREYIQADVRFQPFMRNVTQIIDMVLPALQKTGRPQLGVAFGCTGGRHRSVALAEFLASWAHKKEIKYLLEHLEL